jgi:hypothetical protein
MYVCVMIGKPIEDFSTGCTVVCPCSLAPTTIAMMLLYSVKDNTEALMLCIPAAVYILCLPHPTAAFVATQLLLVVCVIGVMATKEMTLVIICALTVVAGGIEIIPGV